MKKFLVLISVLPLLASAPIALAAVGDTCVPTDPSACLGASPAEICDPNTSKCVDPSQTQASPTLPQTQSQAPASSGGGLNSNATSFFPLTSLPGLTDIATKNDVSGFLQNVYKICIGIAAVLAVLQLVRAGVLYMGGDSVTETKEARRLIGVALGGLLLVLSPVIVFSIINPQILQLNIGVTNLSSSANPSPSYAGPTAAPTATPAAGAAASCNGFTNFTAVPPYGGSTNACIAPQQAVDNSCCPGMSDGFACCAQPKAGP